MLISSYLRQFLTRYEAAKRNRELYPGDVMRHVLSELRVIAVPVIARRFLNIGAPYGMARIAQER